MVLRWDEDDEEEEEEGEEEEEEDERVELRIVERDGWGDLRDVVDPNG